MTAAPSALACAVLCAGGLLLPAVGTGQPPAAVEGQAQRVHQQVRAVTGSDLSSVEALYNAGRDLQEAIRLVPAVAARCRTPVAWLTRFAAASVATAEGYDRLDPARAQRARVAADAAFTRWQAVRSACPPGARRPGRRAGYITPQSFAASFGHVRAALPRGADAAVLSVDGQRIGLLRVAAGRAQGRVTGPAGRHTIRVEFLRRGRVTAAVTSRDVWLLPARSGGRAVARNDAALSARLARVGTGFDGAGAAWVEDLTTGRAAAWNAGARFPAASTVKLAVMVRAGRACPGDVAACRHAYDIRAIGGWSSNLAANRLLAAFGEQEIAQTLRAMGATSSTYPGPYIVATERPPAVATDPPALRTGRVTTAADLAAVMRAIHAAAAGDAASARATGLTRTQALSVLGALLGSERQGENIGVLNPWIPAATLVAQKQGWISDTRNTAAVIYRDSGPQLVVVLASRPGLALTSAQRFGRDVLAAGR